MGRSTTSGRASSRVGLGALSVTLPALSVWLMLAGVGSGSGSSTLSFLGPGALGSGISTDSKS